MKLFTEVLCEKSPVSLHLTDPVCVLGSCFADAVGGRLAAGGFSVLANPFGTLYNPASVAAAVARLDSGEPFTAAECVEMGAGAALVCSYAHHTSFARPTAEEFLQVANERLAADAAAWKRCTRVLVTLGTAWVWRAVELPGRPVVANCLKRPAREFSHELLSVDACAALLRGIVEAHPDKQFIFTVSPIRHLGAGAHANTLSKSTLHLAVQQALSGSGPEVPSSPFGSIALSSLTACGCFPPCGSAEQASFLCSRSLRRFAGVAPSSFAGLTGESPSAPGSSRTFYFPAYEILLDELRDYRFYADDLIHPAPAAVQLIWERFLDTCTDPADRPAILAAERASRAAAHRPLR